MDTKKINLKRLILLVAGPFIMLLCCSLLPESVFPLFKSRVAIGSVLWMAFWWITAPVDYAVTAFLPIALNAIFGMSDMPSVISNYSSETILLLLGASILTVSWEETGLDKRIASFFLRLIGENLRKQIVFWFLFSALLSSVLPNAVVCATITPIAVSMLKYVGENDIGNSKIGSKILLTIAYATGVGGLASPLGGAMNLVTVDYIQKLTGQEYIYSTWVIRFLPIMIVLLISNIIFMLRDVDKTAKLGGARDYFCKETEKLGKTSFEEKISFALFIVAAVLAFTRQFYQSLLPGLKPAYSFVICAIISFLVTRKDGSRLMLWKSVQTKIVWELIYVFAGGLAAGTIMQKSGAAEAIGVFVSGLGLKGGFFTILVIISVTLLLSDVTSNTATAAISIPLVISIVQGIGLNPIPFVYIASVGVNLSYMFPTSIRAIPVGYGLQPKYMMKEGWKMSVVVIVLMTILSYFLLNYWSIFSSI